MAENKVRNERALELRAHVARWIQAHPPDEEQARADCASLVLLGAEAALASGASEEDFITLARDMYLKISSAWQRQS
jgi:hypothetical protein